MRWGGGEKNQLKRRLRGITNVVLHTLNHRQHNRRGARAARTGQHPVQRQGDEHHVEQGRAGADRRGLGECFLRRRHRCSGAGCRAGHGDRGHRGAAFGGGNRMEPRHGGSRRRPRRPAARERRQRGGNRTLRRVEADRRAGDRGLLRRAGVSLERRRDVGHHALRGFRARRGPRHLRGSGLEIRGEDVADTYPVGPGDLLALYTSSACIYPESRQTSTDVVPSRKRTRTRPSPRTSTVGRS